MASVSDDTERWIHILTDVHIMQCQIDAIEELITHRLKSTEALDSEERDKRNALLKRVVTRLRTKAQTLYVALA